jgi:hypothetical protein
MKIKRSRLLQLISESASRQLVYTCVVCCETTLTWRVDLVFSKSSSLGEIVYEIRNGIFTWLHQAGFSPCHWRDGRAGTTILRLVSAFYDRTKDLISDYGPAGAAGAWATPPHPPGPQDSSRDYGPEELRGSSGKLPPSCWFRRAFPRTTGRPPGAADAAVDSAGAAVPSRDYGPDGSAG